MEAEVKILAECNNNKTDLDESKAKFIEKMGLYYEAYGVPRIGGRIIGLLITAEAPLSAEEISTLLKVSRSSVSTNIRLLLLYGFAEVSPGRGSRADCFVLSEHAWANAIRARIAGFQNLKAIAEQGKRAAGPESAALRRLLEMDAWADAEIRSQQNALAEWENEKDR